MIYTIKFDEQQLSILNEAIINLPYKIAVSIIEHINREISENQLDAQAKVKE